MLLDIAEGFATITLNRPDKLNSFTGEMHAQLNQAMQITQSDRGVRALPYPVICAVNGVAAGAGCNLALACDIVIAARSANFIQAFSRIGLIPDAGGTYTLPRLVGTARALAAAMLAEKVSAELAEQWGTFWKCVDDDRLMNEATALARQLARQATRALGLTKRAIYASADNTFNQQLDRERDLQREAGQSEDFRDGVAAFKEKRAAKYGGR
ncbi:MAG: enoyl-CoA hydratase-related protein [Betaproteobacteria bacterium]